MRKRDKERARIRKTKRDWERARMRRVTVSKDEKR